MTPLALRPILIALFSLGAPLGVADDSDDPLPAVEATVQVDDLVDVPSELRQPIFALSDATRAALRSGLRAQALAGLDREIDPSTLNGPRQGTLAFLRAWLLVHLERDTEATPLLDQAAGGADVPEAWLLLVRGEAMLAEQRYDDALAALAVIPEGGALSDRAQVTRAEVLRKLGRTDEGFAIYEALAARTDASPAVPEALLALAQRAGTGSDQAYAMVRRIWTDYPRSAPAAQAGRALVSYGRAPTWQEKARRALAYNDAGFYDTVIAEVGALSPPAGDTSDAACQLLFAKGRSLYKKNQLTSSIAALGDIGKRCAGASEDWGARGLYLKGTAEFRRKLFAQAARSMAQIPEHYPTSSFADDGWLHAGIALQEAGDIPAARAAWEHALTDIPDGDTTPESTWRLAWTYYLDGEPERAVEIADQLGRLPLEGDRRHVEAGRYWAPRWRLYPDVDAPNTPSEVPAARAEAIAGWKSLCRELPHSYYSVLAYSRLVEEAPEVANELARRPSDHRTGDATRPWRVRRAFLEDPDVRAGIDLARMGLLQEARAAWDHAAVPATLPDEAALLFELRIGAGDWLLTHDAMRSWLTSHPPGTLGDEQPEILRLGYPDRYWVEVQKAAPSYRYEPRLFHALVREESNFNKEIVSHAGAQGLSQLMSYTAKQTAGWLKIPVGNLNDPLNNLTIGAKYLDVVHGQLGGSPYLSLSGYNAGPGRTQEWLGTYGNVPTDEFVERIPFRETRGYVRRVTTTWQTYRYQFDDGPAFPDLSRFNRQALPAAE